MLHGEVVGAAIDLDLQLGALIGDFVQLALQGTQLCVLLILENPAMDGQKQEDDDSDRKKRSEEIRFYGSRSHGIISSFP